MNNYNGFLGFVLFLAIGAFTLFVAVKLSDIVYETGVK
jgi:hypothetical protein